MVSPFDSAKCKKTVSEFWEKPESKEIINRQKVIQGFILMGYNGTAIGCVTLPWLSSRPGTPVRPLAEKAL
jgi:hypothetical protein